MSVRRLADEAVQPAKFAFSKDNAEWARAKIREYPKGRKQSAVIPVLMRGQDQEGWVSRVMIEKVAGMLDMPVIRVLEVATFYTQFQLKPVGTRAHVQVCGTTPCMLRGSEDLRAVCKRKIHALAHQTNEAGTLSWEEVECLGACVNAPMVAIGGDTFEDLTPKRLEEIIDAFEAGEGGSIEPGPQNGRVWAAPISGQTSLLEVADKGPVVAGAAPGKNKAVKTKKAKAKSAGKTVKFAAGSGGAPLFEAPLGAPDDLKMISGVGPVLEGKLNALGITKFSQVANFSDKDIARVDERLSFKGRITRENWTGQADALASGGRDEYRRRFSKEPR